MNYNTIWLAGVEYVFTATDIEGAEALDAVKKVAEMLGYAPWKDISLEPNTSIEPGTCMGSENILIGDSCNMPEAPSNETFAALGKFIKVE